MPCLTSPLDLPQVRYELLDCNHTFLESVLKLVGLMESGVVRGGEQLVPYLFQFLVLLAYDNSKLVSVPQVSLPRECGVCSQALALSLSR